jgi:Domain of unknown function (DUF4258)
MANSKHYDRMLIERSIDPEWADRTVEEPERTEPQPDGTVHYLKRISEHGDRWLRVIINESVDPSIRVTAFFDRRLGPGP